MVTECMGLFGRIQPIPYRMSDVWSLGVIFLNMATTRNPWDLATISDPAFKEFLRRPNWLRSRMPINTKFESTVKTMFILDPIYRISLPELRQRISAMSEFKLVPARRQVDYGLRLIPLEAVQPLSMMPVDNSEGFIASEEVAYGQFGFEEVVEAYVHDVDFAEDSAGEEDDELVTPPMAAVPDTAQVITDLEADALTLTAEGGIRIPPPRRAAAANLHVPANLDIESSGKHQAGENGATYIYQRPVKSHGRVLDEHH
jgi:hypothetical protein